MATRYASFGTGIRRSPKTSILQPWYRRSRVGYIGTVPNQINATYAATAHAKGAWAQIVASTAENVSLVILSAQVSAAATDTSTLIDIGVGAAGAETVVVPDVAIGGWNTHQVAIPLAIASGTRVAIRVQGTRTSPAAATIVLHLMSSDEFQATPTSVDIIGVNTGTSAGTAMSGASASWVQMTPATAKDYQAVLILPSTSSTDTAAIAVLYELGIGASGSETVLGAQAASYNTAEAIAPAGARTAFMPPVGGPIPAGSRLAIRHSIATNPDRYNVCLIGIPYV
jgi:hypothetical protein